MFSKFWKIGIPKQTLINLLKEIDADEDGFITIGEVRDILKKYGKRVKTSHKERLIRRK